MCKTRLCLLVTAVMLLGGRLAAAQPTSIYIVPQDVGLAMGAAEQFAVIGEDADGNEVAVTGPITWTVSPSAGPISSGGSFTAGITPGKYWSGVTVQAGGLTASANVEVYPLVQQAGYRLERSIGSLQAGSFDTPLDVAIDSSGHIFVLKQYPPSVSKLDANGNVLAQFSLTNPIGRPASLAVDASGNTYVLDQTASRVTKYDTLGNYSAQWGTTGTGNGQFNVPTDIAVDQTGRVLVVDSKNYRIQLFASSGAYLENWPIRYLGASYILLEPRHCDIDSAGIVYLTTYVSSLTYYLQKLDSLGHAFWQDEYSSLHSDCQLIALPGNRLCALYRNSLAIFDIDDRYLVWGTSWGHFGQEAGMFDGIAGGACGPDGRIYVADYGNNRIQVFDSTGAFIASWYSAGCRKGQFNYPSTVVADAAGGLYVGEAGNCRIQRFDSNGTFISEIGSKRQKDSVFCCPGGMTVDLGDNITLTDAVGMRVLSYTSSGSLVRNWPLSETGWAWSCPTGIMQHMASIFYIADADASVVGSLVWGSGMSFWAGSGTGDGNVMSPMAVAADFAQDIVADYGNNRVQRFRNGVYYDKWGTLGAGDGQFNGPTGVCAGFDGKIFVADSGNCRVQMFTPSHAFLGKIGSQGYGPFGMLDPESVAVDAQGNLYVADTHNHRVMKYSPFTAGSIRDAKLVNNEATCSLAGACVSANWDNAFYVEADNRSSGIRVERASHGLAKGMRANIVGTVKTNADGERYIQATSAVQAAPPNSVGSVAPFAMSNRSVGGGDWNYDSASGAGQKGVKDAAGPNNIGLLITTWGRVTEVEPGATPTWFVIDDGSRIGVKALVGNATAPRQGSLVTVGGVISCEKVGGEMHRLIRACSITPVQTKLGNDAIDRPSGADGIDNLTILDTQPQWAISADGHLAMWHIYAHAYPAVTHDQTMHLEVWRPTANAAQFQLIARDAVVITAGNGAKDIAPSAAAKSKVIEPGDVLGWYAPAGTTPVICMDYWLESPSDPIYAGDGSAWSEGDVVTFYMLAGRRNYSLYADIEVATGP